MSKCHRLLRLSLMFYPFLFFCAAGCTSEEESGPETKRVREISLYHYFSGELSGGLDDMVATVNERQQDRHLTAYPLDHEAFKTMILSLLEKGNPPELFSYWAGARTQSLVDQEKLHPIDDLWRQAGFDLFFPEPIATAACTYNGRKYLVPITQHLVVFFYNKRLLAEAGVTPPKTWLELIQMGRVLKERGSTAFSLGARERWPAQFWFDYLLLRTAGSGYRNALMTGQAAYTDKEVVETYRKWAELIEEGFFNSDVLSIGWVEAVERVCRGDAAATLMGTWAMQILTGAGCGLEPEADFDFFIFPSVIPDMPLVSVGPIDGIVLTNESPNRDVAPAVLAYFAEKQPQQIMSRGSGALAPSSEVEREFYDPFKQRLHEAIQHSDEWAFAYDLATPPLVAEKGMDSFIELFAYPDQFQAILHVLEEETEGLFDR